MLDESWVPFIVFFCNWKEYVIHQVESKPRNSVSCIFQMRRRYLAIMQQREPYLVTAQRSPLGHLGSRIGGSHCLCLAGSYLFHGFGFTGNEAKMLDTVFPVPTPLCAAVC